MKGAKTTASKTGTKARTAKAGGKKTAVTAGKTAAKKTAKTATTGAKKMSGKTAAKMTGKTAGAKKGKAAPKAAGRKTGGAKAAQNHVPASANGSNVLWKFLEMKEARRKEHAGEKPSAAGGPAKEGRVHPIHEKFSRFAGPRRRSV